MAEQKPQFFGDKYVNLIFDTYYTQAKRLLGNCGNNIPIQSKIRRKFISLIVAITFAKYNT
jgi:hypothetical protein